MSTLDQAVRDLFKATKTKSAQQVGKAFVVYVLESAHQGWDGHEPRDKAAYARLLQDFALSLEAGGDELTTPIFTGSEYLTTDR